MYWPRMRMIENKYETNESDYTNEEIIKIVKETLRLMKIYGKTYNGDLIMNIYALEDILKYRQQRLKL